MWKGSVRVLVFWVHVYMKTRTVKLPKATSRMKIPALQLLNTAFTVLFTIADARRPYGANDQAEVRTVHSHDYLVLITSAAVTSIHLFPLSPPSLNHASASVRLWHVIPAITKRCFLDNLQQVEWIAKRADANGKGRSHYIHHQHRPLPVNTAYCRREPLPPYQLS